MGVDIDYYESDYLFQNYGTDVVWTWEVTGEDHPIFYNVVAPSYMRYSVVELTRVVHWTGGILSPKPVVQLHVRLDFFGPEDQRGPLNVGLLNFYAVRFRST